MKVDIIPRSGSVSCMATRAAIAIVVNNKQCKIPDGIVPGVVKVGAGHVAVRIETVCSSALLLPKYKYEPTKEKATLEDFLRRLFLTDPVSSAHSTHLT